VVRSVLVIGSWGLTLAMGVRPAAADPPLPTLDRGDATSEVGVTGAFILFDHLDAPFDRAWRLEPFGQYVHRSGLGGYGAIAFTHAVSESTDPEFDPEPNATGNLDLGMLYAMAARSRSLVVRGGVALPTAADDVAGAYANDATSEIRLTDLALVIPDAWYARLSVSGLARRGMLFARADLGIDLDLTADAPLSHIVRANLGGGVDFGRRAIAVELVTIASNDDLGGDQHARSTFTFSYLFRAGRAPMSISLGGAVDEFHRLDLYLLAALQVPFTR
jgi:hypothetical protein